MPSDLYLRLLVPSDDSLGVFDSGDPIPSPNFREIYVEANPRCPNLTHVYELYNEYLRETARAAQYVVMSAKRYKDILAELHYQIGTYLVDKIDGLSIIVLPGVCEKFMVVVRDPKEEFFHIMQKST